MAKILLRVKSCSIIFKFLSITAILELILVFVILFVFTLLKIN